MKILIGFKRFRPKILLYLEISQENNKLPNVSEGRPEFEKQIQENEILPQSSSETSSDKEDSNVYSQSHIQIRTFF